MGKLSADDIVCFGAVLDREPKKIVEIKKWQPEEEGKRTMNLITLRTILDKAIVPYKQTGSMYEFEVYSGDDKTVAVKIDIHSLRGFIDYDELSNWYVPEKAQLIATAVIDYQKSLTGKGDKRTHNEIIDWYSQKFPGPMAGDWFLPKIEFFDAAYERDCERWYKRMLKEYRNLYIRNAKLGQRIDKNYCEEEGPDTIALCDAMVDQFKATKKVLEALETRIAYSYKYNPKITKYVDLTED